MGFNRDVIRRRRDDLNELGVRVRWLGRRPRLWKRVIAELETAEQMSRRQHHAGPGFCVNYGGRAEIADAAAAIARDVAAGRLKPTGSTSGLRAVPRRAGHARRRSVRPVLGRAAHLQLPALAVPLRRARLPRHALARLRPPAPVARLPATPPATAASAGPCPDPVADDASRTPSATPDAVTPARRRKPFAPVRGARLGSPGGRAAAVEESAHGSVGARRGAVRPGGRRHRGESRDRRGHGGGVGGRRVPVSSPICGWPTSRRIPAAPEAYRLNRRDDADRGRRRDPRRGGEAGVIAVEDLSDPDAPGGCSTSRGEGARRRSTSW